jgi:hypothetical protein
MFRYERTSLNVVQDSYKNRGRSDGIDLRSLPYLGVHHVVIVGLRGRGVG